MSSISPNSPSDPPSRDQATRLLIDAAENGGTEPGSTPSPSRIVKNKDAADKLLEVVYDDCRRLAASYLKKENAGHTLQPTALAHEVYMRLIEQEKVSWKGRTHFLAIAAQAMRRLLIDHARGRDRLKRGGGWQRVQIDGAHEPGVEPKSTEVDVEKLDSVLKELAELDERQAKVVEMRFLAGMTVEEVSEALGVSKRTVEGDWTMARAWLRKRLSEEIE